MPCPEKFKETLVDFKVNPEIIAQINQGYEDVISKSPKSVKAAYFKRAVDIMNERLEPGLMQNILESNACCKSGSREKASKAFAKTHKDDTLEQKIEKIAEVPYMGSAVLNQDGTITVSAVNYWDGEKFLCSCSNFNKVKREYPVSKNYCFCCAGHFKYHYEIMLGVKLKTLEIIASPLDSEGKNPCVIRFEIL